MAARINSSFYQKIDQIGEKLGEGVEQKLFAISRTSVISSPVDTGAFVNSWSLGTSINSWFRSKSSKGMPRNVPAQPEKLNSLTNLANDIELAVENVSAKNVGVSTPAGKYYLQNRAPHAEFVERMYRIKTMVKFQHG